MDFYICICYNEMIILGGEGSFSGRVKTYPEVLILQNNQSKISLNKTGLDDFVNSRFFCYFAPFAVLTAYLIYILAEGKMQAHDNYYILHYLWNYDRGFISRGLVGEVISWFADTVTPTVIDVVSVLGSVFLIVSASLCFGSVLDKTRNCPELRRKATVLIVFLCFLPFTFRSYLTDISHDKFFWAIALLAVFLSQKKIGILLVPVLCIIATLINPLFLLGCMLLVAIVLLNECYESGFSAKNIIVCVISYIGMIAIGVYDVAGAFPDFANAHEMASYFFSRYSEPVSAHVINDLAENYLMDFFVSKSADFIFSEQIQLFLIGWGRGAKTVFNAVFFSIPAMLLFGAFWCRVIREEKKRFGKFIFFLSGATMAAALVFTVLAAWDFPRYIAYSFIVQLGLILYFLVRKNEAVTAVTERIAEFCKNHVAVAAAAVSYVAIFIINH